MEDVDYSDILSRAVTKFNSRDFEEMIHILSPYGEKDVAIDFFLSIGYFNLKQYENCVLYGSLVDSEKLNNIDSFVDLQTKNAIAYIRLNKPKDAEHCMEKLLKVQRQVTNIYYDIGRLYYDIGKEEFSSDYVEDAIRCYKQELMINPDFYIVYNSLGCSYWRLNQFSLSKAAFKKCIEMEPGNNEARKNLAISHFDLKEYSKSKACFNECIKYEPNNSIILYAMSNLYLKLEELEKGFTLYEHRFYKNMKKEMHSCIPKISGLHLWDEVTEHKHLLVIWEQGLGDMIQFYRYVITLSNKYPNMCIDYIVPKNLAYLFKSYNNIRVINTLDKDIKYGAYIYLMSIPKILETNCIEYVSENYINLDDTRIQLWKQKLEFLKRPRVGLFWRGNNITKIQKHIPLGLFKNILGLDIDFISLQKGRGEEETETTENINAFPIDNTAPFIDTVAILKNIDLLITVDTSIVHFAGTMGVDTWLILGDVSEWRWFRDEHQTKWYDTVKLFRNSTSHTWEPVLSNIYDALVKRYNLK